MGTNRSRPPADCASAFRIELRSTPPRSLASLVARPALLDRLEAALERQVVLLQAPAGFGKTTLLTQALTRFRTRKIDCAWLTIDPEDGRRGALPVGIAGALHAAGEADGRPWPEAPASATGRDEPGFGATLIEALARRRERVVLILDHCHVAETDPFDAALDGFLAGLPDNVRVVIAGRRRPAVSLSARRARGLVAEFSATDIQFSPDEIRMLFGPRLGAREIDRMLERTRGWPAMLQLAHQVGDAGAVGGDLAPMHAILREFIADQIVGPMSPPLLELLSKCSIFPQFCGDLAQSVAESRLTPRLGDEMASLAPLVAPVESRPGWLALHPMLREVLGAELDQSPRAIVAQLHRQAAVWFAAHNDLVSAVAHARDAGNFELAAQTIERAGGVRLFIRAGNMVLLDLLEKLPPAVIHASHGLRLARAVVVAKQGRIQEARRLVEEVRAALSGAAERDDARFADIAHIDDLIGIYEDCEVDAAIVAERETMIETIAIGDTWTRGWVYNHLAIQLYRYGDLRRAHQVAHQALACYREEQAPYVQIFMLVHLSLIAVSLGRIAGSLEPSRDAEGLIEARHAREEGLRAIAQTPIAEALYAKNDLVGARQRLDRAIPVMAAGEGWVDIFARALETRIRVALVEEGLAAAIGFLDRGYEIAEARNLWRLHWTMDAMRHEAMCRTGLLVEADEIGAALARDIAAGATTAGQGLTWRERLVGDITLGRGALCRNNPAEAVARLDAAIALGESLGAYQWLIPALILRAIATHRGGDAQSALNSVQRAIAIAAPQGVVRPFIDEGHALTVLIRLVLRRFGIGALSAANSEFVASILNPARIEGESDAPRGHRLLSEREHEVLDLLNHGLANKQIARSVGVSEATVKFHLKNLYGKLGVNSRVMALAVARQQRLLH
jgi:LuxR family maltose regulon positive regulatory protein